MSSAVLFSQCLGRWISRTSKTMKTLPQLVVLWVMTILLGGNWQIDNVPIVSRSIQQHCKTALGGTTSNLPLPVGLILYLVPGKKHTVANLAHRWFVSFPPIQHLFLSLFPPVSFYLLFLSFLWSGSPKCISKKKKNPKKTQTNKQTKKLKKDKVYECLDTFLWLKMKGQFTYDAATCDCCRSEQKQWKHQVIEGRAVRLPLWHHHYPRLPLMVC